MQSNDKLSLKDFDNSVPSFNWLSDGTHANSIFHFQLIYTFSSETSFLQLISKASLFKQ